MKKTISTLIILLFLMGLCTPKAKAHFQMIIPSDDMVSQSENKNISLDIMFNHPFEGEYMDMEQPDQFAVFTSGKNIDLLSSLNSNKTKNHQTWKTNYKIKKPGDHIFYTKPKPYWEPAEGCFIVHYTKVVVNAFGLEEGWDKELGLKTEIIPLTRPYGLWTGNSFSGIVKVDGKPVPFAEIEVEYFNDQGKIKSPADPFITQVIKTDQNGVFTYSMPKAGWWGFAALNEDTEKIKHPDGKEYPIEIGALIWVKTYDMK